MSQDQVSTKSGPAVLQQGSLTRVNSVLSYWPSLISAEEATYSAGQGGQTGASKLTFRLQRLMWHGGSLLVLLHHISRQLWWVLFPLKVPMMTRWDGPFKVASSVSAECALCPYRVSRWLYSTLTWGGRTTSASGPTENVCPRSLARVLMLFVISGRIQMFIDPPGWDAQSPKCGLIFYHALPEPRHVL